MAKFAELGNAWKRTGGTFQLFHGFMSFVSTLGIRQYTPKFSVHELLEPQCEICSYNQVSDSNPGFKIQVFQICPDLMTLQLLAII